MSTPWNWCDRRCERCPRAFDCSLNLRVQEKEREFAERGLDPDDPSTSIQMAIESFQEAIELLTAEAPEIEEDDELSLEPTHEGTELHQAGMRYHQAVEELCARAGPADRGLVGEARLVSMIIVGKTARLLHSLPIRRESIGREDSLLTVLLLSHLEQQAAAMVMAVGAEEELGRLLAYRRARRELRRLIDVHLAGMQRREQEVVERMIAAGLAPSPFCVALGPPLSAA